MSLLLSQAYTHLASLWRASLPGHGERFRVNRQVHLRLEPLEQRQLFSVSPLPLSTLGSNDGVAQVARISRQITTGDGQVSYTADLAIGQKLAFAATVAGSALDVELINPLGQVIVDATATANAPRLQTPLTISTAGSWTIRFASAGTSTLSLDVAVNAGIEYYDITWAQPQSLASGYTLADTVGRFAWVGNTSTADSDDYTVDLTSRVGKSIDITIRGEGSTNLSAQRLELIGPDGEVLATGTPYAMQGAPNNLRIANFVVPTAGVYSIRYVSNVASRYELSVSDTVPLEQFSASNILNLIVTQGWTTKSTVDELLSTLDFDNVFWSMSTDQLLTKLLNLGVVNGYSDLTTLKAALPGHNIDLTILRPDGVLTALATTPTGSLFRSNGTSIDAPQVKNLLKQNYLSDQRAFLNIFDVRSLIGLFDNSITPQAGTMTDPLYVIVDKPIAPTTAKITQSYRLWVKDAGGPEVVSPAEALAATINMPVGYRAFFLTNFLEIPGFDGGLTEAAGYVDTKLSNGNTAQYSLLWMDDWEAVATAKLSTFLSQYKQLGGQLEYLVIDIEDTSLSYHSTRGTDRRVDKSATPTINIWQELLSDPRWPALKAELVARGIPEADLSLANIGTWDVHSANAARWNAVMSERLAGYLNRAIADTVFTYFPDALVSNYGNKYHTQTIPARRYSQLNNSYYSLGPIVGNSQSQSMYGAYTDVTTPGTVSSPNLQFDARVKNVSFIQSTDSNGAKLPRGTAVVTFFEAINGIQVGDEIIVENRGHDWIDSRYTGEYTVSWISADRKSIRYTLQLPNTNAPSTYDLSPRFQVELTAFVVFNRSYERFVGEMKSLRSQVATSSVPLMPWSSNPDYRESIQQFEWDHFSEVILHAGLSNAEAILWWKAGFDTQPGNTAKMSALINELNTLIGFSGRKTLSFNDPQWSDGYVLTGMEANGQNIYRLTPDPHLSMTILSSSGTVRVKIGDKTIEVPNASIYTPSSPASPLGIWIVQTKGGASLKGSVDQVLSQIASAARPTFTGPQSIARGLESTFTLAMNSQLFASNQQFTFRVDWQSDGVTDYAVTTTSGATVNYTFADTAPRTVRVTATAVGTPNVSYVTVLNVTPVASYSVLGNRTPAAEDNGDPSPIEVGMKFRASTDGFVTGVRFYKSAANTGTHTGNLWSSNGTLLATVTFTNETASGWQTADFSQPVAIAANTTYIISYFAPNGHYTTEFGGFTTSQGAGPVQGLASGVDGQNGVFRYGSMGFPDGSYGSSNYFVDVMFAKSLITSVTPSANAGGVTTDSTIRVTFADAMSASTLLAGNVRLCLLDGTVIASNASFDAGTKTLTLTPLVPLAEGTSYTVVICGGEGGVRDASGAMLLAEQRTTFTTIAKVPGDTVFGNLTPAIVENGDPSAIEVGMKFRTLTDGFITGVRFYKSATNTGWHTGRLWNSNGTLLGTVTFTNETASGWQTAMFDSPVFVQAGVTYTVSYFAPNGHYSVEVGGFATPRGNGLVQGLDGVFNYGWSGFPAGSYAASNYFVDVVFVQSFVGAVSPAPGTTNVPTSSAVSVTFTKAIDASSLNGTTVQLVRSNGAVVNAKLTYDAATNTLRIKPKSALAASTLYTIRIRGGAWGVRDAWGTNLAGDVNYVFQTSKKK